MRPGLVATSGLSAAYRDARAWTPALEAVSLEIGRGEKFAIIGESGSGKSTFVKALTGLLPPQARLSGRIDWAERRLRPGRDIGVVFQDPGASLNPVLRIGELVAEGAVAHLGLSWAAARERAVDLLAQVALPDPRAIARAFPHQLSGGQRQRVAIAAALAADPELLVADEATSALDTVVQAQIVALLERLVGERGKTLIFITHDIGLASGIADRVAVFKDARLVEAGPTAQVLSSPASSYTRTLIGTYLDLSSPRLIEEASAP